MSVTKVIKITSTLDKNPSTWTLGGSESSWITATLTNSGSSGGIYFGEFTITAEENPEGNVRTSSLDFNLNGIKKTANVSQTGSTLKVTLSIDSIFYDSVWNDKLSSVSVTATRTRSDDDTTTVNLNNLYYDNTSLGTLQKSIVISKGNTTNSTPIDLSTYNLQTTDNTHTLSIKNNSADNATLINTTVSKITSKTTKTSYGLGSASSTQYPVSVNIGSSYYGNIQVVSSNPTSFPVNYNYVSISHSTLPTWVSSVCVSLENKSISINATGISETSIGGGESFSIDVFYYSTKIGTITLTRQENKITKTEYIYYDPTFDIGSVSDISAKGGTSSVPSISNVKQQYEIIYTYTSGKTTSSGKQTQLNPTYTAYYGKESGSTSTTKSSCQYTKNSLGENATNRTLIGPSFIKIVANNKTAEHYTNVYQEANSIKSYGDLNLDSVIISCSDIPASGGSVTSGSARGTISQTTTWTSGDYTHTYTEYTPQWSGGASGIASLGETPKSRSIVGSNLTAKFTINGKSGTKSTSVYQSENKFISYSSLNLTNVTVTCSDIPASGGTVNSGTAEGTIYQDHKWTSGTYQHSYTSSLYIKSWTGGGSGDNLGTTPTVRTRKGNILYANFLVNGISGQKAKAADSGYVYQEQNKVESTVLKSDNRSLSSTQATNISVTGNKAIPVTYNSTITNTLTYTSTRTIDETMFEAATISVYSGKGKIKKTTSSSEVTELTTTSSSGTIYLSVSENKTTSTYSGQINISKRSGVASLVWTQNACTYSIDTSKISCDYSGTVETVTVTCNNPSVSTDYNYVSCSYKGSGDDWIGYTSDNTNKLRITIHNNSYSTSRSETIYVKFNGKQIGTISVSQDGMPAIKHYYISETSDCPDKQEELTVYASGSKTIYLKTTDTGGTWSWTCTGCEGERDPSVSISDPSLQKTSVSLSYYDDFVGHFSYNSGICKLVYKYS